MKPNIQRATCLLDSRHNISTLKKIIKSLAAACPQKTKLRIRHNNDSLCLHTNISHTEIDQQAKICILSKGFFKELENKGDPLELEIDLKLLAQTITGTKEQTNLTLELKRKSEFESYLRIVTGHEGIYDKIVKLEGRVVEPHQLVDKLKFTPEEIYIESPVEIFDKILNLFKEEFELIMKITEDSLEFESLTVPGKHYGFSPKTFSKYEYPLRGINGNLSIKIPMTATSLIVSIAREKKLPVRISFEYFAETETGNIFIFCEPTTSEFSCFSIALDVKMNIEKDIRPKQSLVEEYKGAINEISHELSKTQINSKNENDENPISEEDKSISKSMQPIKKSSTRLIKKVSEKPHNSQEANTFLQTEVSNNQVGKQKEINNDAEKETKKEVIDSEEGVTGGETQKVLFGGGVNDDYI